MVEMKESGMFRAGKERNDLFFGVNVLQINSSPLEVVWVCHLLVVPLNTCQHLYTYYNWTLVKQRPTYCSKP